jgi:hypothetical protein
MFDGRISRFLFHSNEIRRSLGRPHYCACMPTPNGRWSVFRTDDLSDAAVWDLGDTHVAPGRGKPVVARADLHESTVTGNELRVEPDFPPPRHHNVVGWSSDRAANQLVAQRIADSSRLESHP